MISVTKMFEYVETQKNIAINQPIVILGSEAAVAGISGVTKQFESVLQNPNLFCVCTDKDQYEKTLAKNANRTLVFYLFNSTRIYQESWFVEGIKPRFDELGSFDVYPVDVSKTNYTESEKLKNMRLSRFPAVLVYKAGHLIDKFIPKMDKGDSLTDQLIELKRMQDEKASHFQRVKESDPIADEEKRAFEERLSKKEEDEARREEIEKRRYYLQVKAQIEEDKEVRRKKYNY